MEEELVIGVQTRASLRVCEYAGGGPLLTLLTPPQSPHSLGGQKNPSATLLPGPGQHSGQHLSLLQYRVKLREMGVNRG